VNELSPEHIFWLKNGTPLTNLTELARALETIDEETYNHHVTLIKNDFATWTRDIFAENELANKLSRAKTRTAIHHALQEHLAQKQPKKATAPKKQTQHPHETRTHNANMHTHESLAHHTHYPRIVITTYLTLGIVLGVALAVLLFTFLSP